MMHPQHLIFGFELFGYTTQTELGERVLDCAASLPAAEGSITFDITNYPYNISTIEALKGKKGYLTLKKLTIQSYDTEEMLVLHGVLDDGTPLDTDICEKLFRLSSVEEVHPIASCDAISILNQNSVLIEESMLRESSERNIITFVLIWQGQKGLNPRHAVLEWLFNSENPPYDRIFKPFVAGLK